MASGSRGKSSNEGPSSMPSTISAARSAAAPYSRRPASQPKSSRQQFSACGACRMRRVRCDLKDLPITAGPQPTCSNCQERGIKCVDEFADVKAVKLLRRGRRLLQVEEIYGKAGGAGRVSPSSNLSSSRPRSNIPALHVDFFASPFWTWFSVQRPILDPIEYTARFHAHVKGTRSMQTEGGMIAMLLVIWANSFGLDECGKPEIQPNHPDSSASTTQIFPESSHKGEFFGNRTTELTVVRRGQMKARVNMLLQEILDLIDRHAILRKPTLDGLRVLLLTVPLMEDFAPLESLAIHEASLSQVHALCSTSFFSPSLGHDRADESLNMAARTRLFCYAYTQEGIMTGLKGGHLVLNSYDLENFERSIPSTIFASGSGSPRPSRPRSPSSLDPAHLHEFSPAQRPTSGSSSGRQFSPIKKYLTIPLQISIVCRKVHSVITGVRASRKVEEHGLLDTQGMREIWRDLDRLWMEVETLQNLEIGDSDDEQRRNTQEFIAGWLIFIFECHNIIRESLNQFMTNSPIQATYNTGTPRPSSQSSGSSPYLSAQYLHTVAYRKCSEHLPVIVRIIKQALQRHSGQGGLLAWDTGVIRDGCFFAAYLVANAPSGDISAIPQDRKNIKDETMVSPPISFPREAGEICMEALSCMKWAFSKSEEREETIKMIIQNRTPTRQRTIYELHAGGNITTDYRSTNHVPVMLPVGTTNSEIPLSDRPPSSHHDTSRRPGPASSPLFPSQLLPWPSYSSQETGGPSVTTVRARQSPSYPEMHQTYKEQPLHGYYRGSSEIGQFSFSVPMSDPLVRDMPSTSMATASYTPRHAQPVQTSPSAQLMAQNAYNIRPGSSSINFNSSQFGDNTSRFDS